MKKCSPEELLRSLRCVTLEPNYWDLERYELDIKSIVKLVADSNANAIRVGFFGHKGFAYYPSKIAPQAPHLKGRNLLAEFQTQCEKRGIHLVVYMNAAFDITMYQKHP